MRKTKRQKSSRPSGKGSPSSGHYAGESGQEYFSWQQGWGIETGIIEARKFQKYVGLSDDVIDFGCGGGYILMALRCGEKLGVEINPSALDACTKNGVRALNDIRKVPARAFDIALSNHSLEHVPFPLVSLRELFRVLRPGGRLILCTPMDDWKVYGAYDPADKHHHLHTWSPQNLGNLLSEAGFEDIQAAMLVHAWPPKVVLLNKILPIFLFDLLCGFWSVLARRRQVFAIARKPHEARVDRG